MNSSFFAIAEVLKDEIKLLKFVESSMFTYHSYLREVARLKEIHKDFFKLAAYDVGYENNIKYIIGELRDKEVKALVIKKVKLEISGSRERLKNELPSVKRQLDMLAKVQDLLGIVSFVEKNI